MRFSLSSPPAALQFAIAARKGDVAGVRRAVAMDTSLVRTSAIVFTCLQMATLVAALQIGPEFPSAVAAASTTQLELKGSGGAPPTPPRLSPPRKPATGRKGLSGADLAKGKPLSPPCAAG